MSVSLGIYDFFAYIIPGLLYLFTFNEFLRVIGWKFINIGMLLQVGQTPNITFAILILIVAYLAGHILEPLAYYFYCEFIYNLRHKRKVYDKQLQYMKERYPNLNIRFNPKDWNILFAFIRQRNFDMAKILDKFQADSIMLRNIAFGSLILTLIYTGSFFSTGVWIILLIASGIFFISLLAINKSNKFRTWFYSGVFEASIEYGTSLEEVAAFTSNQNREKRATHNKRSSKTK